MATFEGQVRLSAANVEHVLPAGAYIRYATENDLDSGQRISHAAGSATRRCRCRGRPTMTRIVLSFGEARTRDTRCGLRCPVARATNGKVT